MAAILSQWLAVINAESLIMTRLTLDLRQVSREILR
jgi:hypothetical protein